MRLSLVIPIYNERLFVKSFWSSLKEAPLFDGTSITHVELLVVDDGSNDGTTPIMRQLIAEPFYFKSGERATVHFTHLEKNHGKGYAIRQGIRQSTGDIVLIQDSDLEYSPADIPDLIKPMTSGIADAVFGSRFTGHCRRALFFWHAMMNRVLTIQSNKKSPHHWRPFCMPRHLCPLG